jgi:hypothetical protein
MASSFESDYPTITRWIKQSGHIEIGGSSFADPFVKAVNRDGVLWGGKREYTTIDEALSDLETGIKTSLEDIKSFDLVTVEHALKAVLRPHEAPFWLYHASRDFTGKTDHLIPQSAPMVEEIAGFWRKYSGIKR